MASSFPPPVHSAIRRPRWAVVGASDRPERVSNRIVRLLAERGYDVLPIHPKLSQIDGLTCWPSLSALPEPPDVVNMVVNPTHGAAVVDEAIRLGAAAVWFQPGSEDEALFERVRGAGLDLIEACILVVLGALPDHRPDAAA